MELKVFYILIISAPFIALAFFRPKAAFFTYVVLRPIIDNVSILRTINIVGQLNSLKIIGLMFPVFLLISLFFSKCNYFQNRIANIYLVYILSCIPSVFISNSWINAGGYILQLFTFWAVLIFVLHVIEEEQDIKNLFFAILCASFFPIVRFIISFIVGETLEVDMNLERTVGGYFQMGVISGMLFLFIPAYLFFIEHPLKMTRKILLLFALFFILLCIYKTYYRSALISTFVLFSVYFLLRKNFALLVVMGSGVACALILSPFLQDRLMPLWDTLNHFNLLFDPKNNSFDFMLSGRFGIWRKMTTTYLYSCQIQNLFFGFGVSPIVDGMQIAPHNDYWSALFQHGPFSFILFIVFLFSLIQLAIQGLPHFMFKIILSLLVGSMVLSLSENFFVSVRNLLYLGIYIGILIKSIELQRKGQIKRFVTNPGY